MYRSAFRISRRGFLLGDQRMHHQQRHMCALAGPADWWYALPITSACSVIGLFRTKMHFNVHFMVHKWRCAWCLSVIQYFVGISLQIGWIQSGTVGQSNFTIFVYCIYSFIYFESHKLVFVNGFFSINWKCWHSVSHSTLTSPNTQKQHIRGHLHVV